MLNVALARARREALGLTQDMLAAKLGIGQSALSRLESGEREPRIRFIRIWAEALGITPAELVADPEAAPSGGHDPDPEPAGKAAGR